MKTSEAANQFLMIANELRFLANNSTPETFEQDLKVTLERLELTDQLSDLTFG